MELKDLNVAGEQKLPSLPYVEESKVWLGSGMKFSEGHVLPSGTFVVFRRGSPVSTPAYLILGKVTGRSAPVTRFTFGCVHGGWSGTFQDGAIRIQGGQGTIPATVMWAGGRTQLEQVCSVVKAGDADYNDLYRAGLIAAYLDLTSGV